MVALPSTSSSEHFATLTDPRVDRSKVHPLVEIVTIALCAVICGADAWVAVETFGREQHAWLRTFLALPGGIPSHATFGRGFGRLDPEEFRRCCLRWVRAVVGAPGEPVVAVDGKTLRRSHDRRAGTAALQLVSAWATASGLVLGQVATDAKSNAITALPALLRRLAREGAAVTIDALGWQTAIAAQVVAQGADDVLARKANQPTLPERVRLAFADARAAAGTSLPVADLAPYASRDPGHGRSERRRCLASGDPEYLSYVDPDRAWANLRSVVLIESTRRIGATVRTEARQYLSSVPADAATLARTIRSHGGIENRLHGVLDVAFREDASRVRDGQAPEHLASLRHFALNLLRQDRSTRGSVATKRVRAALNDNDRRSILDGLGG